MGSGQGCGWSARGSRRVLGFEVGSKQKPQRIILEISTGSSYEELKTTFFVAHEHFTAAALRQSLMRYLKI